MTKLGAILGCGILDAGGRNMTISLMSAAGHKKMAAIVGMAVFPQFWYWYPQVHFLSLAFTPTAVVGLNKSLKMPKPFKFESKAPPSLFAYPPPMEIKKEEKKKKIKTATLSVTAKAKAKASILKKKEMDTAEDTSTGDGDTEMKPASEDKKEEEKKEEDKEETKAKEEKTVEPQSEMLENPARVTWKQQKVLTFDEKQRYRPVKKVLTPGVVMLRDTMEGEVEEFVVQAPLKIGVPGISDDEPEPPKPFEFLR